MSDDTGEKLQKVLARRGAGSRRAAESLIGEGKVMVNGKKAKTGARVKDGDDIAVRKERKNKGGGGFDKRGGYGKRGDFDDDGGYKGRGGYRNNNRRNDGNDYGNGDNDNFRRRNKEYRKPFRNDGGRGGYDNPKRGRRDDFGGNNDNRRHNDFHDNKRRQYGDNRPPRGDNKRGDYHKGGGRHYDDNRRKRDDFGGDNDNRRRGEFRGGNRRQYGDNRPPRDNNKRGDYHKGGGRHYDDNRRKDDFRRRGNDRHDRHDKTPRAEQDGYDKTRLRQPQILIYNKPSGTVVSRVPLNESGKSAARPVFDDLPPVKNGRWLSIGRLDVNTEGLLLFVDDGDAANRIAHPRYGVQREYLARVSGELSAAEQKRMCSGIVDEGETLRADDISPAGDDKETGRNKWYRVQMSSGKYRAVRRLFAFFGLRVSRLKRVRMGPFVLPRDLPPGGFVFADIALLAGEDMVKIAEHPPLPDAANAPVFDDDGNADNAEDKQSGAPADDDSGGESTGGEESTTTNDDGGSNGK